MRVFFTAICLLVAIGCSSSQKAAPVVEEPAQNPLIGTWTLQDSSSTIHFISTGRIIIEPGDILASINRFQNTQRDRYTSRLLSTGRYQILDNKEVALFVVADWTGKGSGARRPLEKRVESEIVFEFEVQDSTTLLLNKKMLKQRTENHLHSDETLQFRLLFVE